MATFQSHYGLILSGREGRGSANIPLSIPLWSDFIGLDYGLKLERIKRSPFQSHYGLILSRTLQRAALLFRQPFNPTMVWFYRSPPLAKLPLHILFQSHYGLILSSSYLRLRRAFFRTFQSHYGLILSYIGIKKRNSSFISFQSHYGLILSQRNLNDLHSMGIPFNPTMVWFYHGNLWVLEDGLWTFNPTMVWFYHEKSDMDGHTGATLSIPLWSDFIYHRNFNSQCVESRFQSHYGLILSAISNRWGNMEKEPFNPTMVWFYLQFYMTQVFCM